MKRMISAIALLLAAAAGASGAEPKPAPYTIKTGSPIACDASPFGRFIELGLDQEVMVTRIVGATPSLYQLSDEAFSLPEPYGIMLRKDDAPFKALADKATAAFYRSAEGMQTYAKWFQSPIPPKGLNLNVPMDEKMKKVFSNPTDSPDPAAY